MRGGNRPTRERCLQRRVRIEGRQQPELRFDKHQPGMGKRAAEPGRERFANPGKHRERLSTLVPRLACAKSMRGGVPSAALEQPEVRRMNMTHYMELLSVNQPWNLLIFMGGPIVLAETIAVTELYILYTQDYKGRVRALNRLCSVVVGLYFSVVFVYLVINAVVPITANSGWRGPADVIAVGFYLLGIVPLMGLTLTDLYVIGKRLTDHRRMAVHAG